MALWLKIVRYNFLVYVILIIYLNLKKILPMVVATTIFPINSTSTTAALDDPLTVKSANDANGISLMDNNTKLIAGAIAAVLLLAGLVALILLTIFMR